MKPLKWLGIVIGGIIVLLAVTIGIVSATFDPNDYKDDITRYVKENQQRTLAIPGKLSLSFFPKLGVQVGALSLSEFKSDKVFAQLTGATVSVELLPLLSSQVVVDRVQVDGLSAQVVRGKNGSFNFDDLTHPGTAAADKPGDKPAADATSPAFKLDIDSVKIGDASISYLDENNGTQVAISQLNLQTGRIADKTPTTLDLSAMIQGAKPKVALSLGFKGGMTMDMQARKFSFSKLVASLAGDMQDGAVQLSGLDLKLDADDLQLDTVATVVAVRTLALAAKGTNAGSPFEISLNAPRLNLSQSALSGEAVTGAVKMSGQQKLDAKFSLSGVSGSAKSFAISSITLDYNASNADASAVGSLSTALTGNLDAQIFEFKSIDAKVKIDNPNIPAKTVTLPIRGSVRADLGKGSLAADISTQFDESAIQARLGMPSLAPPSYNFDIQIDKLNADRYRTAAAAGSPAGTPSTPTGTAEKPIDLSALKGLSAKGSVRIGALQTNNVKLSQVAFTLSAAGGKVLIAPLSAGLYGGSMSAAAGIDANSNGYSFKNTLSGVQVGPLLKDAANQDILEGKGNVVIDVTTSGTLPSALKKALNGTVSIKLGDGAIKGINIGERIRNAKALLGSRKGAETANKNEKTDFSELSLSASIANGVATSNDLKMASPLLRAKGAGKVDIGANTLDYTIRPKLVATSKGQEGKTYEQLSGIEMPVKIYGALDAPQYQPDYAAAALSAAQSEIGGKLLEKVGGGKAGALLGSLLGKDAAKPAAPPPAGAAPAPAPTEDKNKKARDLLKGLFN